MEITKEFLDDTLGKILGKITNASIQTASIDKHRRKSGLDGLVIEFITDEPVKDGQLVEIIFGGVMPFTIREVEITSNKKLLCKATESGYWATKLSRKKDLDIRTLIDIDVELVTDADRIKKINEESCWC